MYIGDWMARGERYYGDAVAVVDQHLPVKHDGDLVELRRLPRLLPAGGCVHDGHTDIGRAGVHPAHVLIDGLVAGDGDPSGGGDQGRCGGVAHRWILVRVRD